MAAAIGQSVEGVVQDLHLQLSQQTGLLEELVGKVDAMAHRLAELDKRVAGLEGRVSTTDAPSETSASETEDLYNQGQRLKEQGKYSDAADIFKRALGEESADYSLKGKLFLALFKTLVSLKQGSKILSYKTALKEVFESAQGPDENRIKAAILLCKQEGEYPWGFLEKEKFDEYKGLLLYQQVKMLALNHQLTPEAIDDKVRECLRHNLPLTTQIRCRILALSAFHTEYVMSDLPRHLRKDVSDCDLDSAEELAKETKDLLKSPELTSWKLKTVLKMGAEEVLQDVSSIREEKARIREEKARRSTDSSQKGSWLPWG